MGSKRTFVVISFNESSMMPDVSLEPFATAIQETRAAAKRHFSFPISVREAGLAQGVLHGCGLSGVR